MTEMSSQPATDSWLIGGAKRQEDGLAIRSLRDIDRHEYERLQEAIRLLRSSVASDTFDILCRDMEAVDRLHTILARALVRAPGQTDPHLSQEHFMRRLLSTLANYLSSGRMYSDATLDVLATNHGKDSKTFAAFKLDLATVFDSNSGYRFTYHLRNALQHMGTLPLSLRSTTSDDLDERVQLLANRDALLRGYRWHRKVRADLASGPPQVQLLPLMRQGYQGYVWLERERVRRDLGAAQQQARMLCEAVAACSTAPDEALILAGFERTKGSSDGGMRMPHTSFPSRLFLQTVSAACESGDYDLVLPKGYQRDEGATRGNGTGGILIEPALDLLDIQYALGPDAGGRAIQKTVQSGPRACARTITSLVNLNMVSLAELSLAIGLSSESLLSSWREGPEEVPNLEEK